jgi:hypothetical protein
MSRISLIGLDQPVDWEIALRDVPHSYWHTWRANHAMAVGNGQNCFLFVHEDHESGSKAVCAFAQRSWQGRTDIFTPQGFTGFASRGPCTQVRQEWLSFMHEQRYVCGYFAMHPVVSNPALHSNIEETNTLYVLDLKAGIEGVLAQSSRSVKRARAAWQKAGHSFLTERSLLKSFVLQHYRPFMASVGASARGLLDIRTLEEALEDDLLLMAGVCDDEGLCAAHTFAVSPWGAECHLNISIREGRAYTAPLLLWGMEQLASRQVPWLQMGGGVRAGDDVARAKEKYAPTPRPLMVAREIYDVPAYEDLCEQARQDPAAQGYFPAYRRAATS